MSRTKSEKAAVASQPAADISWMLRLGIERSHDAVFITDRDGAITFVNPAFERVYGFPAAEAVGQTPSILKSDILSPDDYAHFWQDLLAKREVKREFVNKTKDGRLLHIEASSNPILDDDGQITGFLAIHRDITERKQAEQELRQLNEELEQRLAEQTAALNQETEDRKRLRKALLESEDLYRNLVQTAHDLIWTVDQQGNWTFVNQAAQRIYGYEPLEMLSRPFAEFVLPSVLERDLAKFAEVLAGRTISQYETVHLRKDGQPINVSYNAVPLRDASGNVIGAAGTAEDITERKTAEGELNRRARFLEQLNEVLRQISLSDDLQPALTGILRFLAETVDATSVYLSAHDMTARTTSVVAEYYGPEALDAECVSDLGVVYDLEAAFGSSARQIDQLHEHYVIHVDDPDLDENERAHLLKYGAKTELGLTLISKGVVVGTLEIWDSRQKREFSSDEIEAVKSIANQLAAVFDNIRLYDQAIREIEERKRVETALRENEVLFRSLAASAPAAMYICHNNSRFDMIFLSDAFEELTGYPKEPFLEGGMSIVDLYHPDGGAVPETEDEMLASGAYRVTYRVRHKSGEWRWVEDLGSGVFDDEGQLRYLAGFLNDITERRKTEERLQESLERRRRVVELGTQLAQHIAGLPDLLLLYQRVVDQIKEQFGYYHAQLLRYDPALDRVVLIAGYGQTGQKMLAAGHSMPMGIGLIGTAAATGRSVLSSDVREDADWLPNPFLPETRGELAVPIRLGDQVLGVLDVQSDRANALDADDQLALEGLSGQVAIAIESTRLRQEMAERLQELNRLQRIMSREGWQAFQAQKQSELQAYTFDRSTVLPALPDSFASGSNGQEPDPATQVDDTGFVTTPLAIRGEIIGTLGIQNDPEDPLDPEDEELLHTVTAQIAEALEGARLLEQTQQHAVEMGTVARVSAIASTILDVRELLQTVADLTRERFHLYHVAIFLFDQEEEVLFWSTSTELPVPALAGRQATLAEQLPTVIELSHPKSLIARSARSRQPLVVNDVLQGENVLAHPLLPDTRSELTVPLIVGDSLLGVLDLQSDVPFRFGDDDVRIQTTLAAQVAVALQNARLYAEQLATAKRLREVDRLKSEFLASMSHELRTPLNSIIGFADVLLEGIDGPLNERMEEDVTLIRDSGRHLRELIGGILDMSKIEAGMMELRYEEIDMVRLGRELMATARTLVKEKDLVLSFEVEPDIGMIEADRTRLIQVLLNLIGNAIKFTEFGTVTLAVKDQTDHLLVSVKDTGIGLLPEEIPIIFEQFRQIDGSLTRKAGGTGLGVPISKSLVELHGGKMWVESRPGQGSTFWFTIPKRRPSRPRTDTGPFTRPFS
jgi:PAS domain S-box-containing protein